MPADRATPAGEREPERKRRVIVCHAYYSCETGCCGHVVEVDGERVGHFSFSHPGSREEFRAFAEELIREQCGEDHVADLDWENCEVLDD